MKFERNGFADSNGHKTQEHLRKVVQKQTRQDSWLGQEMWNWKLKLGYQCEGSLTCAHKSLIGPHYILDFAKAQARGSWTWSSVSSESSQQFAMAQNNHDPTIDSRQDQERRLSLYFDERLWEQINLMECRMSLWPFQPSTNWTLDFLQICLQSQKIPTDDFGGSNVPATSEAC